MGKKSASVFFVFVFLFCLAPVSFAQTHPEVKISHLSAPFGTSSYVLGSALEEIFKKHPWLHITHSESPGFVFNIKKLDTEPQLKKSMIIGTGAGMKWMATRGMEPFKKKYESPLFLANYNLVSCWLATLDPAITSVKDLAGKRIALGRRTQVNWAIEPEMMLADGWGLGDDKVKLQYVGTSPAKTALLDRVVDACVVGGYLDPITLKVVPSPQTIELEASRRKVTHLSWTKEAVATALQKTGIPLKGVSIPPNIFQGQSKPIDTFADFNIWAVAPEFPEDVAYEFVKTIVKNYKRFGEFHALGKIISPKGMVWGWEPKDMHPGAYKAYKELGLMK
jgi:TRAP transporter TAXI family solute receptor